MIISIFPLTVGSIVSLKAAPDKGYKILTVPKTSSSFPTLTLAGNEIQAVRVCIDPMVKLYDPCTEQYTWVQDPNQGEGRRTVEKIWKYCEPVA